MKTRTALLAISAVLLMTSLSVAPAIAQKAAENTTTVSNALDFTTADERAYANFLNDLTKVKSLDSMNKLVNSYLQKFRDHPLFRWLHHCIVRATIEHHILALRSVRTTAMVISMGTMNRLFTKPNMKMSFYRPNTFWMYGNQGNPFMKSRTFVIDLRPFSIRNVDGRQIGFMHNFYGIYIHRYRPLLGGEHTFFFGHVQRIRTIDLSPFN